MENELLPIILYALLNHSGSVRFCHWRGLVFGIFRNPTIFVSSWISSCIWASQCVLVGMWILFGSFFNLEFYGIHSAFYLSGIVSLYLHFVCLVRMVCVVFVCMFIGFLFFRFAFISFVHCASSMLCTVFFCWSVATCLLPTIANHYVLVAICSHAFEKSRLPCLLEECPDHFFNDSHNHHIANRFLMPCVSCF